MKTKPAPKLPKSLPAAVCAQYVRCGKNRCKCVGGLLHGPYFYCFWREGGRLKKAYVRKSEGSKLWTRYSRQREIRRNRKADRKRFTLLSKDLRKIDALMRGNAPVQL
jgi:hypothetical protein